MLTESEIAEIKARCDAAAKGPWCLDSLCTRVLSKSMSRRPPPKGHPHYVVAQCFTYCGQGSDSDRAQMADTTEFIAHSREDIPKLLADNEALRADLRLNKRLLAKQCDLARASEADVMELKAENAKLRATNEKLLKLCERWLPGLRGEWALLTKETGRMKNAAD